MDFDSLSRRELQSLCKKNKIPANMTNVAMADALKALEHVEGLDDTLIQAESNPLQSPENPRTARRKPSNAEPGSSKCLTSARRATRRAAAEEGDEENKNVDVTKTPAAPTTRRRATVHSARQKVGIHLEEADEGPQKRDVAESSAVPTSRRRAPATSSRWKIDGQKDEGSVQRMYSTRRSVRLLEKSMSELSMKEHGRLEPIKMIEDEESEGKKETSDSAQEIDGLESSGQFCNGLLEDNKKAKHELGAEKCGELENSLVSAVQYQYESEGSNKTDVFFEENGENTADMSNESIKERGTDLLVARVSSEIEALNMVSKSETNEELNDTHDFSFVEVPAVPEEVSAEIMDHVTDSHFPLQHEINESEKGKLYECDESKSVESQQSASSDPDLEPKYSIDEEAKADKSEEKPSESHQENSFGELPKENAPLLPEDIDSVKFESAKGSESTKYFVDYEKSDEVSHQLVSESCDMSDFPDDSTVEDDYSGFESSGNDQIQIADEFGEEESINADNVEALSYSTEKKLTNGPDADVREELNITSTLLEKASEFEFVQQMSPTCPPMVSEGEGVGRIALPKMEAYDSRTLIDDKNVTQAAEFVTTIHENPPSLDKSPSRGKGIGQNAQFAPDSLPGQFPRPYFSSAKKQTTLPMIMQDSGINKENIDLSGCNLEAQKDKMKEKNVIDKGGKVVLEGESIRSLKKMLKKKLTITGSAKEKDPNVTKEEGKTRPALQMVPENCMPVADSLEI
ncbi:uncharacterized protein LOC119997890 isoform X2 [Tripterygium wilfordii]|uniref:uncharacterized protein LOC119997890 isoform X2 n=1 Tax=Tripterygium wilfordii TaxID=458696 RepID=UPI0018F812F4|nr:uncharacterized protein LOC119997890 isoform X2 [Tripterygium wilfordii]